MLLPGMEQAVHYEPRSASLELRALVVAAVRNSLIEDVHSTHPAAPELASYAGRLTNADLAETTKLAIGCFEGMDLATLPLPAWQDAPDIIAGIRERCPRAAAVLRAAAVSEGREIPVTLRADAPSHELPGSDGLLPSAPVFLSGINPRLDDGLIAVLDAIARGAIPFLFSDSFKMLTRNPEKLFFVIDFVLAWGASVVTQNYLLTPARAASRNPLLPPAHFGRDGLQTLDVTAGLTPAHAEALASVREAVTPSVE